MSKIKTTLAVFVVLISATVLFANTEGEEEAERGPTLEERCAWKSIKKTIGQYPQGMAEFKEYTISDSNHYQEAGVLDVQGTLQYTVNGNSISVPFSQTCYIK